MNAVESFDFYGQNIVLVKEAGEDYVLLGQLCQHMGLDVQAQQRGLERQVWAQSKTAVMAVQLPGDNQARNRYLLDVKILGMWLANITSSRINDSHARQMVERYQVELTQKIHEWLTSSTPVPAELTTLQIIDLARESELARIAAERKVAELAPKAAHTDTMREADGLRTITDLTNDLKVHAASNHPGVKVLRDDLFDLAGIVGLIIRGNTVRNNQPTSRAIEAGWVKPKDTKVDTNNHGSFVKVSARLTPRGYGRLWDAAVTNLKIHGQVLAPKKEIAA